MTVFDFMCSVQVWELGKLGVVQFRDLNPEKSPFQRRCVTEVGGAGVSCFCVLMRSFHRFGVAMNLRGGFASCATRYKKRVCVWNTSI